MKFVVKGFVRLRAAVVDGNVVIYIEDSGPGVPQSKRKALFQKFQTSLDSLNQGTGVGLCLSKNLVDLMQGELWLDETYDSGVEECPGARFVIDLKRPPIEMEDDPTQRSLDAAEASACNRAEKTQDAHGPELPEELSVLFVDDDIIVRKLFVRSVKRLAPNWDVQEASNGETCLLLCEKQEFDVIFLDQFMASVDRQLLGTETARALRSQGVKAKLCGLSANDQEQAFLKAGADAFMCKPFPCEREALKLALLKILHVKHD